MKLIHLFELENDKTKYSKRHLALHSNEYLVEVENSESECLAYQSCTRVKFKGDYQVC